MLVTLVATSTNALMDKNKNRHQFVNITIIQTYHLAFQNNFTCLPNVLANLIALIKEMLFIRKLKPSVNVQTDSIRTKVFT